jgi:transcriptional regulator with XRE-family HTH domain
MLEFEYRRVGPVIREQRMAVKLSIDQLAARSGVSPIHLLKIEKLKVRNPQETTIRKIAQGLEVACSSLFGMDQALRNPNLDEVSCGEILQQLRWERDLSLRQLGRITDMNFAHLGVIENGVTPRELTVVKIAQGLGVGVNVLFGEVLKDSKF